jgi:hypothetical protein
MYRERTKATGTKGFNFPYRTRVPFRVSRENCQEVRASQLAYLQRFQSMILDTRYPRRSISGASSSTRYAMLQLFALRHGFDFSNLICPHLLWNNIQTLSNSREHDSGKKPGYWYQAWSWSRKSPRRKAWAWTKSGLKSRILTVTFPGSSAWGLSTKLASGPSASSATPTSLTLIFQISSNNTREPIVFESSHSICMRWLGLVDVGNHIIVPCIEQGVSEGGSEWVQCPNLWVISLHECFNIDELSVHPYQSESILRSTAALAPIFQNILLNLNIQIQLSAISRSLYSLFYRYVRASSDPLFKFIIFIEKNSKFRCK